MEIQLQLVKATARRVKRLLDRAMQKECYGCEVSHPSQIQHQCVMIEDPEERIRFCLDRALRMVNWKKVQTDLSRQRTLQCPTCYVTHAGSGMFGALHP